MELLKQTAGAALYAIGLSFYIIFVAIEFLFKTLFDILTLGIFSRESDWE